MPTSNLVGASNMQPGLPGDESDDSVEFEICITLGATDPGAKQRDSKSSALTLTIRIKHTVFALDTIARHRPA